MEQTNFDVFISYSSKNKQLADAMCHALEQHKIKCWIAPRNVQPGNPYAREIISGLKSSKIMVLVFTRDAGESEHVANELEMAFNYQKAIIPFVAENVPMSDEFNYYLKRKHWLVAYPNPEKSFAELVKAVSKVLGISDNVPMATTTVSESSSQPAKTEAVVHVRPDMDCRIEQQIDVHKTEIKTIKEGFKIHINATNFPDDNFRNYLLKQDYGKDGFLTEEIIKGITSLKLKYKWIKDLKGIEFFTELTELDCSSNGLTSLDVSHNTELTVLDCYANRLTSLDVSHNTKLTVLSCGENQLTSLDVSHNTEMTWLDCIKNQLTSLDVSHNTKLTGLNCMLNQLTFLDVSHHTELTKLNCWSNQLTSLDVSHNTKQTELDCGGNQLTSLDVSHNTELKRLECHHNQLTSLDVSHNTKLTWLNCWLNQLTSLDVSHNTELTYLNCDKNPSLKVDISNNKKIRGFEGTRRRTFGSIFRECFLS